MATTLAALAAGSTTIKYVVAIEGYDKILTDATASAATTAWSGTDWTSALAGGLFVELQNSFEVDPYNAFTGGGNCTITVMDTDGTDEFGIDVYRRSAGAETTLTATIDRNDTTINVAATSAFAAATSDLHIGTECIEYNAKTATTFTASKRGKYSPFPAGATGATRFGNHHRVAYDKNHVLLNPTVSQQPRVWLGRRVGVWMHTVDADGTLNTKADAQLVYAGIIVGIADDANSMCTKLELKHMLDVIKDTTIGGDIFGGEIADGLYLATGRRFDFKDFKSGSGERTANALEVVASGASGANQINAGTYSVDEICGFLSSWLASELTAGRVWGYYSWHSPVNTSVGLRTQCQWSISNASYVSCNWTLTMPGEVSAFLGIYDIAGSERGSSLTVEATGYTNHSPHYTRQGDAVPFSTLVFKPTGPGHAQEFAEAITYQIQNHRGTFVDQYDTLPAILKANAIGSGHEWGVFLLDEKTLMMAAFDAANMEIENGWLAPWSKPGDSETDAVTYAGRRLDEPEKGPVTIRQVYVMTGSAESIILRLFYGSGTTNYNRDTLDTLGAGLGAAIPGSLLGTDFDRSVANLPGAEADLAVIFDEATTLPELIGSDLLLRRASLRWFNEHFEIVTWQSPSGSLSAATLGESNKAAPVGNQENHRAPTLESTVFQRPIVKIDYSRDFSVGRNGDYLKSIQIEDQVAIDDAGGETRPVTIKARNTYADFQGTGAAIEELTKGYLASMPQFSRPSRHIRRSIDHRYWETISAGDIVTVTDEFARDPATGQRGINSRYGTIIAMSWDPGGPSPDGTVRPMTGEVEIRFPDVNRFLPYGPAALVDDTATNAGYDAGTKTLTCYAHKYSESSEAADATHFPATTAVTIIENDPDDPATVTTWDDVVASQTGNTITLTTGLAGWDNTLTYRVMFDSYGDSTSAQHDYAYQADATDQMVEDTEAAYHYSSTDETIAVTANTGTDKAAFHANLLFGDGKSLDAGSDAELVNLINQLIDRKTAHQMPFLSGQLAFRGDSAGPEAIMAGILYFGTDQLGAGVTRTVTVAPWIRYSVSEGAGTAGTVTVTFSRVQPMTSSGVAPSTVYVDTRFGEVYAQASWTANSTSWGVGADQTITLNTKDLMSGCVWVTIETTNGAQCRGLAKCVEGVRTLA